MTVQKRSFTNLQWFIAHAQNTVHMAAYLREPVSRAEFEGIVEHIVKSAPQILWSENLEDDCYETGKTWPQERYLEFHQHEIFSTSYGDLAAPLEKSFATSNGPTFQAICHTSNELDENGMRSCILLRSSHALIEGLDLVQVLRGRNANHKPNYTGNQPASLFKRFAAAALAPVSVLLHFGGVLFQKEDQRHFSFRSLALDSKGFRKAARDLKISQRALMFALVLYYFSRPNVKKGKTQMMIYTTLSDFGIIDDRDDYLHFKIRLLFQRDSANFADYAKSLDRALEKQAGKGNFNQHYYNKGLWILRKLVSWFPRLSSKTLFDYAPYDMMLSMVPPLRPTGVMAKLRNGHLFGGTLTGKGRNCVFLPGADTLTFNFWAEDAYYKALPGLLEKLDELDIECSLTDDSR